MANLIYSAIASLDGYVADEDGNFDWAVPDEEVHAFINDLNRSVGTYLYGRRMYETMAGWETDPTLADRSPYMRDFAEIWQAADKIVYSKTLEAISTARTRIERDFDPEGVRRMKALAGRDLIVGGPQLAAQAFEAGLVDECHLFVAPMVVGGGKRSLPDNVRLKLDLLDERRFGSGMVARHPSLATLLYVAAGLGASISELVEEPEERRPGTVVRGAEAPIFEGEGLRFQPLMPEAGPQGLSAAKVIFPAGRAEPEYHRHEGEEWLYVLSGRLRLTLGEEDTVLEPGDAAFFDGMLPHAFDVLGEEDVEVLFVAGAVSGSDRAAGRGRNPGRLHPFREGHRVVDTELRAMEEGAESAREG
jgi:dihydrofolate reductase/quercetin dioxygenase-like cupin family protein